jgi:hypothetical protein
MTTPDYGRDNHLVNITLKNFKPVIGSLYFHGLSFHSLPPFPKELSYLQISQNEELTTLPALPEGLRSFRCHNNPNLTTITGLCPEGIKNAPAGYVFANCPKLKIQPNPRETCGEFFRRFAIAEATGKKATDQAIRDVYERNTNQDSTPGTGPVDRIRSFLGVQPRKGTGRKKTRKSKKRRTTRKSKLTRSR